MTTRIRVGVGALCLAASLALLAANFSSVAAAKPAKSPLTGKLSKPGYTVIALAASGKATSVVTKHRKFKLRPPAKRVTLQLRAKDGTYAGPIVVDEAKKGKRAILGVKVGAKLGKVKVKARKGYAKLTRALPKRWLDPKRWARARKGVPIGAGRFGRVRSRHTHGGAPGDLDLDGIPDPLDVDDDGDLVLDNLDRSPAGGGARAAEGCGPNNFYCQTISSNLAPANPEQTVNANAGSTPGQVDAVLSRLGVLRMAILGNSAELDCGGQPDPANPDGWIGGLPYCTRGGTGALFISGPAQPFPGPPGGQFDPDADGFGTMTPSYGPTDFFLKHGATTAQIKTGDILTQRITIDGTETQVPATINYIFSTVPALVSYSDTAGNSSTASYPVAHGDPGTTGNGFPVSAPAGQDVVLTLTFWRPQRQPIAGSDPPTAQWMDIGHLTYSAYAPAAGHPALAGGCPQSTFSTTDPDLAPPTLPLLGTGGLADLKDDQVSSPSNTLTYKLNLSQCLAANGLSFNPGDEQTINFMAVAGATDTAEQQGISFKRQ
jgi:hypothetical protein